MDCITTLAAFLGWLRFPNTLPPRHQRDQICAHLVRCSACQAALHEVAARGEPPFPLLLRALLEHQCTAHLAKLSACAELLPSQALHHYPVSWMHIELCPFCREQYYMLTTVSQNTEPVKNDAAATPQAAPKRPPCLVRLPRHELRAAVSHFLQRHQPADAALLEAATERHFMLWDGSMPNLAEWHAEVHVRSTRRQGRRRWSVHVRMVGPDRPPPVAEVQLIYGTVIQTALLRGNEAIFHNVPADSITALPPADDLVLRFR